MSSIDQRIVEMKFNNGGFESGVKKTLGSLKTLNESLKMKNATNGLDEVGRGISRLNGSGLTGLSSGVDAVASRFSTLGIIGVTALANITNSALNAGKNLVKSFTLDPITAGFQEYETKMNSIQTILTNTASKGTNINDVNKALNELNTYADKTIYNFSEMTRNIGTFTAAGVDLDTSVKAIKGIANLAAGSGSSPQQASTAMYQLSQALAAGKVSLQDWNSVVNAGMGGELFQKALIDTAKGMGKVVDSGKPFRETLQDGWLTTDVLTKTLQKFADDPALVKAATQVKTFSGLMDTMKESVQSGWAQSMEYIFGNKDQAANLFTGISEGFNNIIGPSADARNAMLKFWNENGGREAIISGLTNVMGSLGKGLGAVKEAFREVFPPMTGKKLVDLSNGFKGFTEKLKMSDKTAGMIKSTFKGVFSVLDFGKNAVVSVVKAFAPMGGIFATLGRGALTVTSSIGKFFSSLNKSAQASGIFDKFVNGIHKGLDNIGKFFDNAIKGVGKFFESLAKLNFAPVFDFIGKVGSGLGKGMESIFGGLGEAISKINFNTVIGAIAALAAGKGLSTLKSITETIKGAFDSLLGITDSVSGVLDGVRESLQAYQNNLNAGTLLKLAASIGILALALGVLAGIDAKSMETALTGITMLFIELIAGLAVLLKIAAGNKFKGFFAMSTAMVAFSAGILILSAAMKNLSSLNWQEVCVGLTSLAGLMTILVASTKLLAGTSKGLVRTSAGLIVLATALMMMSSAVKMFGQMDTGTMVQGLIGVGVALAELALFLKVTDFNAMGIKSSVGILILAGALNALAAAVGTLGSMDVGQVIQGLSSVGVLLAELAIFSKLASGKGGMISLGVGLIALGAAMNILSVAVGSMGSLPFDVIGKGLLTMAGSLAIIAAAVKLIPGGSLIATSVGIGLMSGALLILSSALQSMGGMAWEEIAKSLVTLSGSLTILAVAMAFMTTGLPGAAAMMVMSAALALFVPQLIALSQLSLAEVGIGLLALAGAFTVLGLASLVLTPLVPVILALGGAIAVLGVGCMAAGAGVALFATGLATLATVGVAGGMALAEVFRQLINLLPQLGQKMAEGLTNFITTMASAIPQLVTAAGQLITGFLQAFTNALPKIADASLKLVTTLCDTLSKAIPQLMDLGVKLLLALLTGISNNIGKITTTAVDIIVKFVDTLSNNVGRLIQAGIGLVNSLANGIRQNGPAIRSAFTNLITAAISAITGLSPQFLSKGMEAAGKFVSGILGKNGASRSAGNNVATSAKNGAQSGSSGMNSVGSNMIQGMINGIRSKASAAASAALDAAKGAVKAAKNWLGIHSPSRRFMGIGKWSILGFAKGLRNNMGISSDTSREVAKDAVNNMSNPLKKVADIINGNVDATPTIRPVMDLSSVERGSKTLRDMIANNESLQLGGFTSGSLSKSIRSVQSGVDNSEIVSELKSLKKEIGSNVGNSYTINGVTYDDGSNVSNAVETLVHAAKIERRI